MPPPEGAGSASAGRRAGRIGRAAWSAARAVAADPTRLGAFVAAVAVVLVASAASRAYLRNVVDDSLISMRYAENLALGNGPVFNPGERVEGYTNFLWVVVLAAVHAVARAVRTDFVFAAIQTSILLAAADVLLVWFVGKRLWGGRVLPAIAALGLVAADDSFAVWSAMALEKHLFALWVLVAIALMLSEARRKAVWIGACLACVCATRPDGALFVAAFAASGLAGAAGARIAAWWRGKPDGDARAAARDVAVALGVWAVAYGAYFAWRWNYYGWPLPNTFYLKVASPGFDGWERGVRYLTEFLDDRAWIPLAAVPAVFGARNGAVRTLWIWTALHIGYVVKVGGDFYPGHRFYVVVVPAIGILCGQVVFGATEILRRGRAGRWLDARWAGRLAVAAPFLAVVGWAVHRVAALGLERGPIVTEVRTWAGVLDQNRRFMRWLRGAAAPGASIVAGDIGSAGLYAGLRVVDYYGVIDPVVAHQKVASLGRGKPGHEKWATVDHVLSTRPTYVKAGYVPADLWSRGYFLDASQPFEFGVDGIWVRDPLPATGDWDEPTAIRFDPGRYDGWAETGDAFAEWPTSGPGAGQREVDGRSGGYLSSWHPTRGDAATGRLVSAPVPLVGDLLVLRVGGGRDPEHLRVSLVVGGERVCSFSGRDSDVLSRRTCDIAPHRGRLATLEFVDERRGPWGHIVVDEIVQWRRR